MFLYIFSIIFIVVFIFLLNQNSNSVILLTRKSTHSKVDAPEKVIWSKDHASSVDQTGEAFLFLLVPLIEKGKKRYNQTPKGNE